VTCGRQRREDDLVYGLTPFFYDHRRRSAGLVEKSVVCKNRATL
jgi:hypothetical protein